MWRVVIDLETHENRYTKHEIAMRLRNYAVVADWLTRQEYKNLVTVADTLDEEGYTSTDQTVVGRAIDALE